jgi:hypothetical protein
MVTEEELNILADGIEELRHSLELDDCPYSPEEVKDDGN